MNECTSGITYYSKKMADFDARLTYLNQTLYNIADTDYDDQNLKYLREGVDQIIKKDVFYKELMYDGMMREYFRQYEILDVRGAFEAEYSDLNFESFKKAYTSVYQTYHLNLSIEDMETFDWKSEFRPNH